MTQTKIITMPSAKIREVARVAMEGYWLQITLFMGLFYLINTCVSNVLDLFFVATQSLPLENGETYVQTVYYGSGIYTALVSGPLTWSMSKFLLDFFRYQKVEQTTLLEGFSHFVKTVVLMLLMGLKILLWGLLFILPGIVASIRYSQAFYVMVDHPEYTPNQCLKESCRIMNGNKQKYVFLYLSFIGWSLLALIPTFCFSTQLFNASGVAFILMDLVLSIPIFFVNSYLNMTMTVFYEMATDNLTIVMEDAPAEFVPAEFVPAQDVPAEPAEPIEPAVPAADVPVIEEPKETEEFKLPEE